MHKLSPEVDQTICRAVTAATTRRAQYTTIEHLLLQLLDDPDASPLMRAYAIDTETTRADLVAYTTHQVEIMPDSVTFDRPTPTAALHRAIQRAVDLVQSSGRDILTGADIFIAIMADNESKVALLIEETPQTS